MRQTAPLLLAFFAACSSSPVPGPADPASDREAVLALLHAQSDAWNRGDIDAFVTGYWQSEKLVFASGDKVNRGYHATLERYRKNYDTPEKMGKLKFRELTFESLTANQAVITGRWELRRAADNPGGVFTLILRKFPEGWRIVHDHTSSRRND